MTIKTFTTTLLLTASFLLFTACDSKTNTNTTNDQNFTSQGETPTGTDDEGSNSGGEGGGTITSGGTTGSSGSTDGNTEVDTSTGGGDDSNATAEGDDDNNTTTSPTITLASLKLIVDKTTLNKDENTTVKVMATYSDSSTKDVTDAVEWVVIPSDAVKMTNAALTALQDKATTVKAKLNTVTSDAVSLNITWTVNGHTLPPEPDKTVNDSTLLGIDSNNDGVRDDIERKVYATYPKAIQRAVMMQAFRAKQKMLADPDMVDNAKVWEKRVTKYIDCTRYLYMYKKQARISRKEASLISEWQFNNKARVKTYIDYNKALSGGVYSINKPKLEDCDFNVDEVLELDK